MISGKSRPPTPFLPVSEEIQELRQNVAVQSAQLLCSLPKGSGVLRAGSRGQPPAPFPLPAPELPAGLSLAAPSQVAGSPTPRFTIAG